MTILPAPETPDDQEPLDDGNSDTNDVAVTDADPSDVPSTVSGSPWPPPVLEARRTQKMGRRRVISIVLVTVLAMLIGPLVALVSAKSGFAEITPGPGIDISGDVTGSIKDSGFPRKTGVMGMTVGVKEVSVARYWWLSLRGENLIELNAKDQSASATMMDQSQLVSSIVANEFVTGSTADIVVVVQDVLAGSPADRSGISAGDLIRAARIQGESSAEKIRTPEDAVTFVKKAGPGAKVAISIERNGVERTEAVTIGKDGRIGVLLGIAAPEQMLKVEVTGVGGSSAGLAMALALIDALSPGDLTAGFAIAATGEIDLNGDVFPIGGIAQKLRSPTARAATLVFIPAGQPDVPKDANVVRVGSVAEAVAELCKRGATDDICDARD